MIELEAISEVSAMAYRSTRLAALRDSPKAFDSTHAVESRLTDADWVEQARGFDGARAVAFLAQEQGVWCGMAAGTLDTEDRRRAYLSSMWVAPSHRGRGVGRRLVTAVRRWAAAQRFQEMVLEVSEANVVALAFYQRLGFKKTGRARPYENDPALFELEMVCRIEPMED